MGFTRYWVRPEELDAEIFSLFSSECDEACREFTDYLKDPMFNDVVVLFEGNPGCEPFIIERVSSHAKRENRRRENGIFEYCKTEHFPYDKAVAKCLELLKAHFLEVEIPEPS